METSELIKRVKRIEIKSRGLSNNIFAGEYHSAFKGRGMMFSEVREYTPGDDVRKIDWNVTARYGHPYIKVFEEERELTVMLLIDVSGSRMFGSTNKGLKKNLMTEIAAVLSFSAITNNDKIGVLLFSDKVEKYIPPKKGRGHILQIISNLLVFEPESNKTNLSEALRYLTNAVKRRCTTFLISDFMDKGFEHSLSIANRKHDVVGIRIYDPREAELPALGLLRLKDAETGKYQWVNSFSKKTRIHYKTNWLKFNARLQDIFTRTGVDFTDIDISKDYLTALRRLFKKREMR